ncbi:MAG TPA: hypothetical protein VEI02_01660 [Planctomycetota bacterium]|nr:hypothetical protein [Planctomycetota bacterium]
MSRMSLRARSLVLLAASAATAFGQETYGFGSAGTGGFTPTLSAPQPWIGDAAWGVTVGHGRGASTGLLFVSGAPDAQVLSGIPVWFDFGLALPPFFVALDGTPGLGGDGDAFFPAAVPALPALVGVSVYWQAAIDDPTGPLGIAVTAGLKTTLTMPPQVAVGASIGGSNDPLHLVNPTTLAADFPVQGDVCTDNVNGLLYTDAGRTLWASSGFGRLCTADLTGAAPVWTTRDAFVGGTGVAWNNLRYDASRRLVWTLQKLPTQAIELMAYDADPASPTFGARLHETSGVSLVVGLIGVWGMSHDGAVAAIPSLLAGGLYLFDVDPASPTFGQMTSFTTIPATGASALWINNVVEFSADDTEIYVLRQGAGPTPSEVARYSLLTQTWIDHVLATPAVDNVGVTCGAPFGAAGASMQALPAGHGFVATGGFGSPSWLARVDLDPVDPTVVVYTPSTGALVSGGGGTPRLALDVDGQLLAVGVVPLAVQFYDAQTMVFLNSVVLPSGGISVLAFR